MNRLGLAAIVAASLIAGCDPQYGSLRMKEGAGEVGAAYISDTGIVLEEGKVVVIFAEPISARSDNEYEGLERFELTSSNESIATIHRGVLRDSFVIVGASPGTTRMEVLVDNRQQETVPLEVTEWGGGQ